MKMYIRFLEALGPWFRKKFAWLPHNLIAHPVSEVAHWFGFEKFGNWIHDSTAVHEMTPKEEHRG